MSTKENDQLEQEEIFSKILRAGRRTYFFDVRTTKSDDYYITITESKKFVEEDGSFHFKKHKIYLYKEDFSEFSELLNNMVDFIIDKKGLEVISECHQKGFKKDKNNYDQKDLKEKEEKNLKSSFTNLNFEDI